MRSHRPWRCYLRALYPPWDVLDDPRRNTPQENVARDAELAALIARAPSGAAVAPLYRVWTNQQCLVVTKREQDLATFDAAVEASAQRGWPVALRDSGGTVVPHGPTTVLLTLIMPRRPAPEPHADTVFTLLCTPAIEALAALGIMADYGAVSRSFCDGRFNLVVADRKIAGTSQRWRGGLPGHSVHAGFILAHLALYVAANMDAATGAVNTFLREVGRPSSFDPTVMTTVQAIAPSHLAALPAMALQERVRSTLLDVLYTRTSKRAGTARESRM